MATPKDLLRLIDTQLKLLRLGVKLSDGELLLVIEILDDLNELGVIFSDGLAAEARSYRAAFVAQRTTIGAMHTLSRRSVHDQ